MAALVFALCGGLAVVYIFFAAFGAIDVGEAVTASVIALGLGLVWMIGFGVRIAEARPPRRSAPRPQSAHAVSSSAARPCPRL